MAQRISRTVVVYEYYVREGESEYTVVKYGKPATATEIKKFDKCELVGQSVKKFSMNLEDFCIDADEEVL